MVEDHQDTTGSDDAGGPVETEAEAGELVLDFFNSVRHEANSHENIREAAEAWEAREKAENQAAAAASAAAAPLEGNPAKRKHAEEGPAGEPDRRLRTRHARRCQTGGGL